MFDIDALPSRIREKIAVRDSGHWEWIGAISTAGYGKVHWEGRVTEAHRVVYTLLVGPIPPGMVLDHICHTPGACTARGRDCRHRRCQNPGHVRVTTQGSNSLRSDSPPALNATKDSCDAGHPYEPGSFTTTEGHRRCLVCRREKDKKRRPRGVSRKDRIYVGRKPGPRGANGDTPERRQRDAEILRLRADGLTFAAIGASLGISEGFASARYKTLATRAAVC